MPSLSASPAVLRITGAAAQTIPARFTATHARLTLTGATAGFASGSTSLSVTTPKLDRLFRAIDKADGETDKQFQRRQLIWQQTMEAIEGAFAALTTQVTDNTTLLAQIQAALTLAQAANDNATAVSQSVDISNSYTDPVNILSASSDGTITIAAHNRVYPVTGASVAVSAGSLTGQSGNVTVYYADAGRVGGAVSYQGTTDAVAQTGNTHIVGQVTVPEAGEPPAQGSGPTAPGYKLPTDWDVDVGYIGSA